MDNEYQKIIQIVGAETLGSVQSLNVGKADDTTPIYYELQTQEIELGNRAHFKKISNEIVVLTEFGIDSSLEAQEDDGNFKPVPVNLNQPVSIGKDIKLEGHYFTFKWSGEAKETSPIFNGLYLESITDQGITNG